jgi:hypothetical protein
MKYHLALLPLFLFFSQRSFAQFKNTFAPNGNPTTQIIDASGMKQGNWNYYDTGDKVFRTEMYTDNVLTGSKYFHKGTATDMIGFQYRQLSQLSSAAIDFITKKIQTVGSGELIILPDGSVHLHFYLDKLKAKVPQDISLDVVKQLALKSSIIKF